MIPHLVRADELNHSQAGWVIAHTVNETGGKRILARKGDRIGPELVNALLPLGERELHLLEPEPGELHENEAGIRLVRAVAGQGIRVTGPSESQYELIADRRGLLRVHVDLLRQINAIDGISILTRFDYQPVNEGEPLAGVKVTPILMPRERIEQAEAIGKDQSPLEVLAFQPLRVGVLVAERVNASNLDRFRSALERKLDWYGGTLVSLLHTENHEPSFMRYLSELASQDLDLMMVAGASSLDPLEPLFGALRQLDARIVKHGVPIHPGSLFWIVEVHGVPLFGLSSCEMFSHKTVLDLIMPRLFAGVPVTRDALVELGHGGMLGQEMAFRFPPYD
ncbi:MAG TPA: hypothetical protein VHX16_09890, partial [Chloroflexota bacterium]|nr:hypothetical protein [Chloroflexota bacterium]